MPSSILSLRSRMDSALFFCLASALLLVLFIPTPASSSQEKLESSARLEWFDQHTAMKETSPFKEIPWRFIGP